VFPKLASHNEDLRRLLDKGYACAVDGSFLIVRDISYLDGQGAVQIGAIVTDLEFVDKERVRQKDHQVYFAGTFPHGLDGKPLPNLGGGETRLALSDASTDVVVQRSFSNKPKKTGVFPDFFEKIESYVGIISGPAMHRGGPSPLTFREVAGGAPDPIFKFQDTLTSRASVSDLAAKFESDTVVIIGLGGTGGYLLDFLVKTRVREIRGFDLDAYHVHNAFRSPGKLDPSDLGKTKAAVYQARYENFRSGLTLTQKFIDASSVEEMKGVTFAFVCVDKGSSRAGIFELLLSLGIPFIDVGLGLNRKKGPLNGMIRTTYYSVEDGKKVRDMQLAELTDRPDEEYRTNVQISELNALNACLAVIKFKQVRGFYFEEAPLYNMLFEIGDLKIAASSHAENN
jgi:hypothetical protein